MKKYRHRSRSGPRGASTTSTGEEAEPYNQRRVLVVEKRWKKYPSQRAKPSPAPKPSPPTAQAEWKRHRRQPNDDDSSAPQQLKALWSPRLLPVVVAELISPLPCRAMGERPANTPYLLKEREALCCSIVNRLIGCGDGPVLLLSSKGGCFNGWACQAPHSPSKHRESAREDIQLRFPSFTHREPSFPMTFTTKSGAEPRQQPSLVGAAVVVVLLSCCCGSGGEWVQCGALAGEGIKAAQSSASYVYASPPPLSHFIHISALNIVIVVESMLIPYCANRQIH
ncbi:hypothetical protein DdX_08779 [Ditylenchus destructor]|uniref:Uncharacterized protein n=1 Tax=Ditylenchus destructor TaxID=166010 RepID=A0AAD4N3U4_9BILA|nr:hypothetical protein DdX_08779 [Ditylenchus destructor]